MNPVLAPLAIETVLVTWRAVQDGKKLPVPYMPLPSTYTSILIVFGGLSLLPDSAKQVQSIAAWGFVIATALNFWTPSGKIRAVNQVASENSRATA